MYPLDIPTTEWDPRRARIVLSEEPFVCLDDPSETRMHASGHELLHCGCIVPIMLSDGSVAKFMFFGTFSYYEFEEVE